MDRFQDKVMLEPGAQVKPGRSYRTVVFSAGTAPLTTCELPVQEEKEARMDEK